MNDARLAPAKVHIRGLDSLTTAEIRGFALEHFPAEKPVRIEWIDDTSANIIYETNDVAMLALASLIHDVEPAQVVGASSELRKAKQLSTHPDTQLLVRPALLTDIKAPNARETSRFYLMNPDKDPGERRRHQNGSRAYRRGDDNRERRPREAEPAPFTESMYDDDTGVVASVPTLSARMERQRSDSDMEVDEPRRRGRGRGEDLFAGKLAKSSRLRDRSASPRAAQDGDGRLGFSESTGELVARRSRRRSNPAPNGVSVRGNAGKELLPGKKEPVTALHGTGNGVELFPAKFPSATNSAVKELFPRRASSGESNHRRTGALDAADNTRDLFADRLPPSTLRSRSRNMTDHIENPSNQRTAPVTVNPGFSIRGAAGVTAQTKELFPSKSGINAGKELFGASTKTTGTRRRAEDMFT